MAGSSAAQRINTVVLVHGGFVDGSGWRGVYDILKNDGFSVSVVQNPTISLQGDAAVTRLAIDEQTGPVVLVGHSYGGAVITEAGTHPKVERLVYITAFAPDDACECRKPKPKLILDAASTLGVDPSCCVVVGDRESDVEAARNAGAIPLKIEGPNGLEEAVRVILTAVEG